MDILINAAEHSVNPKYYGKLLAKAITFTGPIAYTDGGDYVAIYGAKDSAITLAELHRPFGKMLVKSAYGELVPEQVLKHWRPEERGDNFPRGIPFEALT